ncbi:MAG: TRAP transporter small permease [Gammaproteobacteria bacterium]|nr:TRAP transporter small permease [Gammaproteobacteria bacterium]MYD01964.1 TRAP transporter small permease [Gammaproteobacteria bacterium]MYI25512.1 TRAP transporter small permease [Gammaproteobacteria bacterium]
MRRLEQRLDRAAGRLAGLVLKVAAAGLVAMTLVIGWQVFARYVLNASPPWSEAAALIVMVSFVLLAAAVGVYEKFHLGFRWLVTRLPMQSRRAVFVSGQVLILVFGAAMAFNGMALVDYTATHIIPTLGISRSVAYWPFVVCGVLMALFACVNCLNVFLGRRDADPWN